MNEHHTETLSADVNGIKRAANLLAQGDIVSFPTETVYGLGGDARNAEAVARIYAAKGRPSFNPLIVHVANVEQAQRYAQWSDAADILAQAFWPGPLSLVLPLREGHGLASLVTAGLSSVAIRVPAHPSAHALLRAFDGPVAAPSANPSGRISPTSAAHVLDGLDGKIAAVLDDGPCSVGVESTIVAAHGAPTLLRLGGLPIEAIEAALGAPLAAPSSSKINAPGQLQSHYAPQASMRLNAQSAHGNEVLLGFGAMNCDLNLSTTGNLVEAASQLFDHLHRLDTMQRPIAVAAVPERGLGRAINDRLRRAAAPR